MFRIIYKNELYYFISSLIFLILSAHFFSLICPCIIGVEKCEVKYFNDTDGLIRIFITGSFFGPLLETAIFQYLPIYIYNKYAIRKTFHRKCILIGISAILFGFTHDYNILTIIDASIAGIIFALIYLYFKERNKSGFFFTFLIHFLYNTYAFIIDDLIK